MESSGGDITSQSFIGLCGNDCDCGNNVFIELFVENIVVFVVPNIGWDTAEVPKKLIILIIVVFN
jgi:hypothetical protein